MAHFLFNVCCVGVEPPRQGGSPQAKAGRKYGGQPTVDERSWRENFIFAKSIPRNQDSPQKSAVFYFTTLYTKPSQNCLGYTGATTTQDSKNCSIRRKSDVLIKKNSFLYRHEFDAKSMDVGVDRDHTLHQRLWARVRFNRYSLCQNDK